MSVKAEIKQGEGSYTLPPCPCLEPACCSAIPAAAWRRQHNGGEERRLASSWLFTLQCSLLTSFCKIHGKGKIVPHTAIPAAYQA